MADVTTRKATRPSERAALEAGRGAEGARPLFDPTIVKQAIGASVRKLDPRHQIRNPVMFVVEVGSALTTALFIHALAAKGEESAGFIGAISASLVHGAVRELRRGDGGGARQGAGRHAPQGPQGDQGRPAPGGPARRDPGGRRRLRAPQGRFRPRRGRRLIPGDGEVVEGVASVDESAVTGESAPVIRESGGDRSAVTGGTRVLSDWLVVRITANPGEAFLDRMIALVEGAKRQKTPNEIALDILLAALTIVFLLACVTLLPLFHLQRERGRQGSPITITVLVALLVCLIPTTIGGLLSAIGIAGMDRLIQANVIAMSGRAVEAAGDVDVLLLDKTGTITLGNRQATEFIPAAGVKPARTWPTRRSSRRSPTRRPRGAASWSWRRTNTASGSATSPSSGPRSSPSPRRRA
jgi:K+-transporting ATPase ATPase B chain